MYKLIGQIGRIIALAMGLICSAQTYAQTQNPNLTENYIHYTLESGLPTTMIYNCVQDKKGFIWFGSFAGLIRFDGRDFFTYTKKHGLPDNEIISTAVDSLGRIWAYPFSKKPVFIQQNVVHSEQNDAMLKQIQNINLMRFQTSSSSPHMIVYGGNAQNHFSFYVIADTHIVTFQQPDTKKLRAISFVNDSVRIIYQDSIHYPQNPKKNHAFHFPYLTSSYQSKYIHTSNGFYLILNAETASKLLEFKNEGPQSTPQLKRTYPLPGKVMAYHVEGENKLYLSLESGGYIVLDINQAFSAQPQIKLANVFIGGMLKDKNGNLWFATMGDGIYCLPPNPILKVTDTQLPQSKTFIQSIFKDEDGEIFLGNSDGKIQRLTANFQVDKQIQLGSGQYNRIIQMEKSLFAPNDLYIACDNGFFIWHNYKQHQAQIEKIYPQASKCLYQSPIHQQVFIGTSGALLSYNPENQTLNKLLSTRTTAIHGDEDGKLYIGGLDGLSTFQPSTLSYQPILQNKLNSRITHIAKSKMGLWVSTASEGLYLVNHNQIIQHIDKSKGLISDNITNLYLEASGNLWVGTDKGLNHIVWENGNLDKPHIIGYNQQIGLIDNTINDIASIHDTLIFASYKGLSLYPFGQTTLHSPISTYITNVKINGRDTLLLPHYILPFTQNTLTLSFAAVCFDCNEDIYYYYRLIGEQENPQMTFQKQIEFGALSPGEYVFEVYAIQSTHPVTKIYFTILPPWWGTIWALTAFSFLVLGLLGGGVFLLFTLYRKRLNTRHQVEKRVKDLELQALRSQMNPHFIFNCLGSIQYFMNLGEIETANIYMDKFAKLIRKTLEFSQTSLNSVSEECAYLDNYLLLEKMRFEDKFEYQIEVAEGINVHEMYLPSLILQPYVENAIRHGLRYKTGNEGKIWIRFYKKGQMLVCEVEDNGIGRQKAASLRSNMHIEYQSQGMKLSEARLMLHNTPQYEETKVEIVDLTDTLGIAKGTMIRLFIKTDLDFA